jgi:hypothetical protein
MTTCYSSRLRRPFATASAGLLFILGSASNAAAVTALARTRVIAAPVETGAEYAQPVRETIAVTVPPIAVAPIGIAPIALPPILPPIVPPGGGSVCISDRFPSVSDIMARVAPAVVGLQNESPETSWVSALSQLRLPRIVEGDGDFVMAEPHEKRVSISVYHGSNLVPGEDFSAHDLVFPLNVEQVETVSVDSEVMVFKVKFAGSQPTPPTTFEPVPTVQPVPAPVPRPVVPRPPYPRPPKYPCLLCDVIDIQPLEPLSLIDASVAVADAGPVLLKKGALSSALVADSASETASVLGSVLPQVRPAPTCSIRVVPIVTTAPPCGHEGGYVEIFYAPRERRILHMVAPPQNGARWTFPTRRGLSASYGLYGASRDEVRLRYHRRDCRVSDSAGCVRPEPQQDGTDVLVWNPAGGSLQNLTSANVQHFAATWEVDTTQTCIDLDTPTAALVQLRTVDASPAPNDTSPDPGTTDRCTP